jgi:hypothetical protein
MMLVELVSLGGYYCVHQSTHTAAAGRNSEHKRIAYSARQPLHKYYNGKYPEK